MSRVLVVEDEAHLARGLQFNLEVEGYAVEAVENGEAAEKRLAREPAFDLVLLDVMLPGKDGFTVVRELREAGHYVPVLMLTARGRAEDILKGLEAGADDYLPKPFDLPVLLARIRSLLRRREWARETVAEDDGEGVFFIGGRRIELEQQRIVHGETVQPLTLMEANLLRYLIENQGRAVSRKELLEEVWGVREDTDTRAVDNFIVRLRRYLEEEPANPRHLLTVRGLGYRFEAEPGG